MFEAEPLTEHRDVMELWLDDTSKELTMPNEDSGVHDLTGDSRYLFVQLQSLQGTVKQNHDAQNAKRDSLGARLGNRIDAHDERVRDLELEQARHDYGKLEKRLEKVEGNFTRMLMIVSLIALAIGGAASKLIIP